MRNYRGLTDKVTELTEAQFRPATEEEIRQLAALGLPESVLSFYSEFAPVEQIEHGIILFTIEALIRENKEMGPAYIVCPHGYISFADTCMDDTYCFDLKHCNKSGEPRIVLFSHEDVSEGCSPEQIAKYAKPVAAHLYEFLQHFIEGTVVEE